MPLRAKTAASGLSSRTSARWQGYEAHRGVLHQRRMSVLLYFARSPCPFYGLAVNCALRSCPVVQHSIPRGGFAKRWSRNGVSPQATGGRTWKFAAFQASSRLAQGDQAPG